VLSLETLFSPTLSLSFPFPKQFRMSSSLPTLL
jgi:hypothetical protein